MKNEKFAQYTGCPVTLVVFLRGVFKNVNKPRTRISLLNQILVWYWLFELNN